MVMYKIFGDFLQEESPDYEGLFLEPTLRCNHLPFSYAIRGVISAWNYIFMQRLHPDSLEGVQHKETDERHAAFYRWKLEIHVLISLIFSSWSVIQLPDWPTKICQIFFIKYLWGYSLKSSAFKASGQAPWGTWNDETDPQWLYGDKGVFCWINKLGLCSAVQYQWLFVNCSVDEKNELIIHDNQLINWWKKWIAFVKIKFHLNENVEWHCMQLELNMDSFFIWIEFSYRISMQLNSI